MLPLIFNPRESGAQQRQGLARAGWALQQRVRPIIKGAYHPRDVFHLAGVGFEWKLDRYAAHVQSELSLAQVLFFHCHTTVGINQNKNTYSEVEAEASGR